MAFETGQRPASFSRRKRSSSIRSAKMPSRSGRCIPKPKPPDSSPPIIAPVSIILGPTYLNPTGTSCTTHAVSLAQPLGHRGFVDRLHHRLAQAAVLDEVVHEQGEDLQSGDEDAPLVGCPGPVRVAVQEQPQVRMTVRR